MRLGIFAKTFPGTDPATVLAAVKAAGFEVAQYNMACSGLPSMPDGIDAAAAEAVAAAAADAGVDIVAVSGTYNIIHPDRAIRVAGHARLEMLAARAHAMGTRFVTLCTGTRDPHDQWTAHPDNGTSEAWCDLLEAMQVAVTIADRHDVDLGIEPELANVVSTARKSRQLIDQLASPRVKIVLDPANLFEVASADERHRLVEEAVDLLADRLVMAHAKDRTADGGFTTAGRGVLDIPHFLARLRAAGFDGPLVTHGLTADEAPAVAAFLSAALDGGGA